MPMKHPTEVCDRAVRLTFRTDTELAGSAGGWVGCKSVAREVPVKGNRSCFVRADFVRVKQTMSARRRTVLGTTRLTVEIHSTLSEKIPKEVNV